MAFAVDDLGQIIRGASSAVYKAIPMEPRHINDLKLDCSQLELRIFNEQCRSRAIGLTPGLIEKIRIIGFLDAEGRAIDQPEIRCVIADVPLLMP